jgi:hypothetical protein
VTLGPIKFAGARISTRVRFEVPSIAEMAFFLARAIFASCTSSGSAANACQREDCVFVTPRSFNWVAWRNPIRPRPPLSRSPVLAISASNSPALVSARLQMSIAGRSSSGSLRCFIDFTSSIRVASASALRATEWERLSEVPQDEFETAFSLSARRVSGGVLAGPSGDNSAIAKLSLMGSKSSPLGRHGMSLAGQCSGPCTSPSARGEK